MISLDRVRVLLSLAPGPHGGTLMDTSMVHDLARDVLTLADALATADASIAQLRADLERADHERQRVESERDAMEEQRDTARSALDALAAAVRAEREARRVARLAQSERDALEDDAWPDGDDDERAALAAAGERLDTAEVDHDAKRDHLTALLAGAPCGYVEARVVRAYLAAVEAFDGGALGAPCRASIRVDNTRAALVAALEK